MSEIRETNITKNPNDTASYAIEDPDVEKLKSLYKEYSQTHPDLIRALRTLSLGEIMTVRAIEHFGVDHVFEILFSINIYKLMEIDGFGFFRADNCAKQLNYAQDDPRREKALIQHVLENNKNFGNVYLNTTVLEKECKKQNVHDFSKRLDEMIKDNKVVLDGNRIYLRKLYIAETETAEMVKNLIPN